MTERQAIPLAPLCAHGDHVLPIYAAGDRVAESNTSADGVKKRGGLRLRPARGLFSKHERAADTPQTFGWLKAVYPEAIEFTAMRQELQGMPMIQAAIGLMIGGGGLAVFLTMMVLIQDWIVWMVGVAVCLGCLLFLLWMVGTPLRMLWGGPRDLPIVFDRQHRKVYVMQQEHAPGLFGLLKPWPIKACAYDWDLVQAEHNTEVAPQGGTGVRRIHRLAFTVRKSADDPTLIGHFQVAVGLALTEPMVAPMWEHIRRFMEERGPHLPHPSEPLDERNDDKPTWWQSAGETGPFGPRYAWWWKEHTLITLFYHVIGIPGIAFFIEGWIRMNGNPVAFLALLAPYIPLSINWGQATGVWLVAHTSRLYDWPQAVHDAIGAATRKGAGW